MNWFLKVLKQYADFNGRARRKELWIYILILIIIFLIAAMLDNILGTTFKIAGQSAGYGIFYLLVGLATLLPSIAVEVRRLHDINKSGWYLLIGFIPLIGAIILLIWFVKDGDKGVNQYGAEPKNESEPEDLI